MDLDATAKFLSKRAAFSSKRVAFLAVVGLCLVGGILLRSGQYFGQPEGDQAAPVAVPAPPTAVAAPPAAVATEPVPNTAPATQEAVSAPNEEAAPVAAPPAAGSTESGPNTAPPAQEAVSAPTQEGEPAAGDAAQQAEQPEPAGAGMILVSRRPIEILASPSSSASAMYGFPAGRPFRLVGREGGFAKIQDLKSGASGWIDETALAPPPRAPAVSAPSQPKPAAVGRKPATASADPKPKAMKPATASTDPKPKATKPATALTDPKPKATKKDTPVTSDPEVAAETETAQTPKRPALFGQGGLFGGIFGNKN